MIYQTISLPESVSPGGTLTVYIQHTPKELTIQKRPLILICPGGGYGCVSVRESELLALPFLPMGYHVAVLTYSVAPHRYPTQLTELAYSMMYLRQRAEEWRIDGDKIIVAGCSAGGHLAASLGVFWQEEWLAKKVGAAHSDTLKPNGLLLCYPVITSGQHRNKGSFEALLGENPDPELWNKVSLEHRVSEHTPPTFLWHTMDDGVVPVENSLYFVSALRQHNIPCEFHMYPHGIHGLSRCSEQTAFPGNDAFVNPHCESWIGLAHTWIESL